MSTSQSTGKGNEKAKPSVPNTSQENPGQKGADKKGPAPSGSGSILQDGDHARVPVPARSTSATTRSQAQRTHAPGANTSTSTAANPNQSTSENSTTSLEAITPGTKIAIASQAKGREGSLETNHKAIVRGPASSTTSAPKQKRIVFAEKILAKAEESLDDARVARLAADENSRKLCDAKIDLCEAECQTAIESLRLLEIGATDQERDRALEVFKAREAFYAAKVVTAEKLQELLKDEASNDEISVTNNLYKAKEAVWEAKVKTAEKILATKQVTAKALESFMVWEAVCQARVSLCDANWAYFKRTRESNIDELKNSIAMSEALVSLRRAELDLFEKEQSPAQHAELLFLRARCEFHRKNFICCEKKKNLFKDGKNWIEVHVDPVIRSAEGEVDRAQENMNSAEVSLMDSLNPKEVEFGKTLPAEVSKEALEKMKWSEIVHLKRCAVALPLFGLGGKGVWAFEKEGFHVDTKTTCEATPDILKIYEARRSPLRSEESEFRELVSSYMGVIDSLRISLDFQLDRTEESPVHMEAVVLIRNWVLIRFELETMYSLNQVTKDLQQKSFIWSATTHGPLKFQLGVAVVDMKFRVVLLEPSEENTIKMTEIVTLDMKKRESRIHFLRIVLNVAMYSHAQKWNGPQEHFISIPYMKPPFIDRNENTLWYQFLLGQAVVHKAYNRNGSYERIERMKQFYDACTDIPGLEKCLGWKRNESICLLTPLCVDREPKDKEEFRAAIISVVKTLTEVHKRGWIHGDVKWSNIRPQLISNSLSWTLIDCEFAIPCVARRVTATKKTASSTNKKGIVTYTHPEELNKLLVYCGEEPDQIIEGQIASGKVDLTLRDMLMVGKLTENVSDDWNSDVCKLGQDLMGTSNKKRRAAFRKIASLNP